MEGPKDMWSVQDYLGRQRRETDEKYDYRYSVLISVFAQLIGEGWIDLDDLDGLAEDKTDRIKHIVS